MNSNKQLLIIFLIIQFLAFGLTLKLDDLKNVVIASVNRKINLETQYPNYMTKLKILNGKERSITKFYYMIPKDQSDKLTTLSFAGDNTKNSQKDDFEDLSYKIIDDLNLKEKFDVNIYEVTLSKEVKPKEEFGLIIQENYSIRMRFFPQQIKLKQDQLVIFEETTFLFSPYLVKDQVITFLLPSKLVNYTKAEEANTKHKTIVYGPYKNIEQFSINNIRLHYENSIPFAIFKKVQTVIEVSQWGTILNKGFYTLKNDGAQLTGEYGRVDYNNYIPNNGKNAIKKINAELPYHAFSAYLRDEVGNISTSNAYRDHKRQNVQMEIRPRYPIFGGWKANFELGFNLPTEFYLFSDNQNNNEYILKQFFGFPFESIVAEEYELKVILPEGAKNIEPSFPFPVDEQSLTYTYSFLDTEGKPTLIFKKNMVSDEHHQLFTIKYEYNKINFLKKPFKLFTYILIVVIAIIFFNRNTFQSLKKKFD